MTKRAYVRCPDCLKQVRLRRDGYVAAHRGRLGSLCSWSWSLWIFGRKP